MTTKVRMIKLADMRMEYSPTARNREFRALDQAGTQTISYLPQIITLMANTCSLIQRQLFTGMRTKAISLLASSHVYVPVTRLTYITHTRSNIHMHSPLAASLTL